MKKFLGTFFKTCIIIVGVCALALTGIVAGSMYGYIDQLEHIDIKNLKMNFTTFVYAKDPATGQYVEIEKLYGDQNRVWVDIDKMPRHLLDAAISIEDERFYQHAGFDIKRIIGAGMNFVTRGTSEYGGSTITQQLIKGLTGDDDVSLRRKVQEIYRAYLLEKELSKSQILELYLNTIFLSQQCNGVQTAANVYFGKDVSQLSIAESAAIIGITQYPSLYDPFVNPEKNKEKQEIVLAKMLQLGKISKSQHDAAVAEELEFTRNNPTVHQTQAQSYYVDAVIDEVMADLQREKGYTKSIASKMLYSGGLKVYCSMDTNVQTAMDEVFEDDSKFPSFKGEEQPHSAMVVMDPYDGKVLGVVGGRGEKKGQRTLNRAVHSVRQPGSAIKPIAVYAPGLEYGHITAASEISDSPLTINGWSPKNASGSFAGPVTIRYSVEKSLNIPAVKVLQKVSIDASYNFLTTNLKITSLVQGETRGDGYHTDKTYPSLALGGLTDGVSVLELTAAYSPFANSGIYTKPSFYEKVLDNNGRVILENKKTSNVAMSEQTAFIMTSLLRGVVQSGTGGGAAVSGGIPTAGKTGTTNDDKDRWFVGYTPYYVGGTWFGYDNPRPLVSLKGNPSLTVWKAVMDKIHKNKQNRDFQQPTGVSAERICMDSGMLASELCEKDARGSRVKNEVFGRSSGQRELCNLHKEYEICSESGLRASQNCPADLVTKRIGVIVASPSEEEKDKVVPQAVCTLAHQGTPSPSPSSPTSMDQPTQRQQPRNPASDFYSDSGL